MIKKRLIGVVTIKNNMAVQSFGYDKYLPLGNPVNLIENLDRWGADEILVQVIDRSRNQNGPDFELLDTLSTLGLSTPLIYSGGINSHEIAIEVIKKGADRVVVDSAFHSNPQIVKNITQSLGNQAVILSLPVHIIKDCLFVFNYLLKCDIALDELLLNTIESIGVSELLLIDHIHEGYVNAFEADLVKLFPLLKIPFITFGGISSSVQVANLANESRISAVAIGNFLNYREHAIQSIKKEINSNLFRFAEYYSSEII